MANIVTATPKGFRDLLPAASIKRQFVVDQLTSVFKKFGFDPLETPTLEYAQTLKGKYGEEEKLIYEFKTRGGDQVALRYDQTVPLARIMAQYPSIPKPFKRYQIQSAFRGENPQKGRYREFLQCDADIIGVSSPLADAEILGVIFEAYENLGLEVTIKVNDRTLLYDIEPKYLGVIDKLGKIGEGSVLAELQTRGLPNPQATELLNRVRNLKPTDNLMQIRELFSKLGYPTDSILFDPVMVRGLDYYTGFIVEVVLKSDPNSPSLGGGGRWDNMIGKFTGINQPAVGYSFGVDRIIDAMEIEKLLNLASTRSKVLVTIFSPEFLGQSIAITAHLRSSGINTEIWLDPGTKLEKQLKYADQKGIPYALILGPEESAGGKLTLKTLLTKNQELLTSDEVVTKLEHLS